MDENLIKRLESAVTRLEMISAAGVRSSGAAGVDCDSVSMDPSIIAFDDLISEYVNRLTAVGEKIGGSVSDVSKIIEAAFLAQKELLIKTKRYQKPDMAGLVEFLKPLNDVINKATALTEGRPDFFHHLKTSADSLTSLAWIAYTGKNCGISMPIAHVEESWQMAEFYCNKVASFLEIGAKRNNFTLDAKMNCMGRIFVSMFDGGANVMNQCASIGVLKIPNKILVEYRNRDANHVEWAKALKELYVPGLRDYVKRHYPLGPVWNATGKTVTASAPPKPRTGGPGGPAPPPPPPASLFSSEASQPSSSHPKEGMSAVFQEINSGKSVTAGLRKVTNDMKTKNRADRTGAVSVGEKKQGGAAPSVSKVGPPKFELQMGRKWVVENQIGEKSLTIKDCDSKQSVYIFGCKYSVLQIQGKVNNITIDKCTKMGLVFTDVVAACEIVNCNAVEVQCQGSAPTISVDNTAGCQLYLSKDSLEASITTAKSSEINVLVPGSGSDSDWAEHSLPQQYIHVYKDDHFVTSPVSHSGA